MKLPYKYDYRTDKYSTCGQFCSWSCMKTFALEKYGITRGGQIMCNIVTMRKKLYNVVDRIEAAPSRLSLEQFGGNLTIEEFRKNTTVDGGPRKVIENCVPHETVEFVKRVPLIPSSKLEDISYSKGTNEPLRLKRSKPLKRDANNLETSLGIVRKKTTL